MPAHDWDIDKALDLKPSELYAQTYIRVQAYPIQGGIFASIDIDAVRAAQASGRTLGEAIMNAGACMAGIPLHPVSTELLQKLVKDV